MSLDTIICTSCQYGPCKLGDIAKSCKKTPSLTVQEVINLQAIEIIKAKK